MLAPIKLHVDAKRYLCATRAGYFEALSIDSKRSLALQGGVFTPQEAAAFIAQPYAADAVRGPAVGRPGEGPAAVTPPLAHFVPITGSGAAHRRPRRVTAARAG